MRSGQKWCRNPSEDRSHFKRPEGPEAFFGNGHFDWGKVAGKFGFSFAPTQDVRLETSLLFGTMINALVSKEESDADAMERRI